MLSSIIIITLFGPTKSNEKFISKVAKEVQSVMREKKTWF